MVPAPSPRAPPGHSSLTPHTATHPDSALSPLWGATTYKKSFSSPHHCDTSQPSPWGHLSSFCVPQVPAPICHHRCNTLIVMSWLLPVCIAGTLDGPGPQRWPWGCRRPSALAPTGPFLREPYWIDASLQTSGRHLGHCTPTGSHPRRDLVPHSYLPTYRILCPEDRR